MKTDRLKVFFPSKTGIALALLLAIATLHAQSNVADEKAAEADATRASAGAYDTTRASAQATLAAQRAAQSALRANGKALEAQTHRQLSQLDALRTGLAGLDARAPSEQEQLAIAALEGLMAVPPERALPLLKKVLNGNQSDLVKARALFVLVQSGHKEAPGIVLEFAKRGSPALRVEAIRTIGIGGEKTSVDALSQIYATGDQNTKEAVLEALMVAEQPEQVYQIAINAKSEAEVEGAVRMLGAMEASDQLRRLSAAGRGGAALLDALAISGDLASLKKLALGAPDQRTRIDAASGIGIIDTPEARAALREIYQSQQSAEVRAAALQGMLIADDSAGVLALYKAASTATEKRIILRTLSMMDGDAAMQAIDAALDGRSP
jgi:HEAT repeat protein